MGTQMKTRIESCDERSENEHGEPTFPAVCVLTHPLAAAGENATRSLLDILDAITDVSLVTADLPGDSEIRDQYEVHELSQKSAGDSIFVAAVRFLLNQLRMCAVLRRRSEPLALFYGATSYILPIVVARLLGKRVLVEPRGDVPLTLRLAWEQRIPSPMAAGLAGIVRVLERAGFAVADGVVTYTPQMAEQLGLDPDDDSVYPTGARYVQTDQFNVQIPFEERELRVGFVGRLAEEKNIRELARIAQQLPDEITFTFVGDGELRSWLERTLAEEIAAGSVEMRGWVPHDRVPAELNRLQLLILPSAPTEGLPTTILEAQACGTVVCATPVSGVPDVINDGETGFLLNRNSAEDLHETIMTALQDPELINISKKCEKQTVQTFGFEAAKQRYESIIKKFVSQNELT